MRTNLAPCPAFNLQQLESRQLLSVSYDSAGYTVIAPEPDSRVIYVSSSQGNDANDGLSPNTPVKTIERAGRLIRNRMPDQILLKRGDVFDGGIRYWKASGRSATEPVVLGAYGVGERPLVRSGTVDGFSIVGGSVSTVRHVAVQGIEFWANGYNGRNGTPYGIRIQMLGSNFLIEDCLVRGYKDNIVLGAPDAPVSNVKLRRNVVVDAYSVSVGHSQGLYASGTVSGIYMEGNVFDRNGWNPAVPGAVPTVFNHNVYIQTDASTVTAIDNIFARGSLHGAMIRCGGIVKNNLFVENAVGLGIFGREKTIVTGNVILNGVDLPTLPSGVGINSEGYGGSLFFDNIIANDFSSNPVNSSGIALNWQSSSVKVESNIIYNWRRAVRNGSAGPTWVQNNHFQTPRGDRVLVDHRVTPDGVKYDYNANVYSSPRTNWHMIKGAEVTFPSWRQRMDEKTAVVQTLAYPAPNRGPHTYNASLGGVASTSAFLNEARKTSRSNYRTAYTALPVIRHVRLGFGLLPDPSTNIPAVPGPGTPPSGTTGGGTTSGGGTTTGTTTGGTTSGGTTTGGTTSGGTTTGGSTGGTTGSTGGSTGGTTGGTSGGTTGSGSSSGGTTGSTNGGITGGIGILPPDYGAGALRVAATPSVASLAGYATNVRPVHTSPFSSVSINGITDDVLSSLR